MGKEKKIYATSKMFLKMCFLLMKALLCAHLCMYLKLILCAKPVHNQNQCNQINHFRRAIRMVIRQCFNY